MTSRCTTLLLQSRRAASLSARRSSPLLQSARWLHEPSATFDSAKLNGNIATASEDSSPTPRRASKRASERRKRSTSAARAATAAKASASTSSSPAEAADKDEGKKRPLMTSFKDGKPWITVMGLGGAGSNAVNNMIASQLEGVEFIVANTDCQALGRSLAPHKITLGKDITKGLGAGSKPELGKCSAEQQKEDIQQMLQDSNMLFITGGMGGGTCTGAAPVVASVARELGILTVGVVSTPFRSEGPNRTRLANAGVKELAKYVDTLIVVPNQNLLALADKSTTMLEAFRYADDVLLEGVKGVTDLIVRPGLINLDFADIKTILSNAGRAIMGSGISSEEGRARKAAEQALVNPLLGDLPTESAHGLLVTIRGGEDMTLFEVDEIMEIIRSRVHDEANIIFGTCYDQSLEGSVYVSIIVSGIQTDVISPPIGGAHVPLQETHKRAETGEFVVKPNPDDEKPAEQRKGLFGRFFSL
ncbi:Cell division protein [Phytophthora idaei]|nr:Cell division protein [Phytophthora idaei]KAG3174142.1 Cell division protein [Phytophthora idaei]KAG3254957.1 Cell division protein [Phytophthora idaei]